MSLAFHEQMPFSALWLCRLKMSLEKVERKETNSQYVLSNVLKTDHWHCISDWDLKFRLSYYRQLHKESKGAIWSCNQPNPESLL